MLTGETGDRPTQPYGLPPYRDKLPTLPCDLTAFAWEQTGPDSWTADRFDDELSAIDSEWFEFSIDEETCVAGPLIGVSGSAVPRAALPASQFAFLELDYRQGLILSLLDGCGSVDELLGTSGLPESETLAILCDLCARNIVTLEQAG